MFFDFFASAPLTSVEIIDDALANFECAVDKYNFERALRGLIENEQSHILPLILSNLNPLRGWITESFPTDPSTFAMSVHHELLLKLSTFFLVTDLPIQQGIDTSFQYSVIPKIPGLLKALCTLEFVVEVDQGNATASSPQSAKRGQKQKKKNKRAEAKSRALDEKLFHELKLDLKLPESKEDANDAAALILVQQKTFLELYLDNLHAEGIAETLKVLSVVPIDEAQPPPADNKPQVEFDDKPLPVPSAYPKVQPIKSALYFDSVTGFGAWTILINQNAESELRVRHKRDRTSFNVIVKKIRDLSNGHFSGDNQKRLAGPDTEVPIFEAKMTGDLRLIYQIDVISSGDQQEQQAIKILGVYTHAQMDKRLWQSIGQHLENKGKEYKRRCSFRKPAPKSDGQTFIPESWPPLPELELHEQGTLPDLLTDDNHNHSAYSRFLMEKYVVFSQPVLNAMLADVEVTFPHLVSSQERLIIEHPLSCYVIGRSGTGKTTTLLFKMLLVERTYQLAAGEGPKPRQIFVTRSRVLAEKVEKYFVSLVRSLATTNQSPEELKAIYGSISFNDEDEVGDIFNKDDDLDWSGNLPEKFSELQDKHFPLFTTFDLLCSMLEADMSDHKLPEQNHSPRVLLSKRLNAHTQQAVPLTYEQFLSDYWPRFTQSLVKRLDPALVFSEFLGVIQGSEETLKGGSPYHLTRLEYENMSMRSHSTFAESRETLYSLFTAYLDRKRECGQIDGADRTHMILDFLDMHGVPGEKVDHLYVDEVQDNLLIDTLILRALCHDSNGLFWSGDTAQTISVGSSFRFDALKAFQWRLERRRSGSRKSQRQNTDPETFQLAANYRSHSGIVNCAHSVIELITYFWKDSIDKLSPERGVVDGPKPVFFVGWDEGSRGLEFSLDNFVFGDSGNRIEFGAEQCIIVRDEAAKNKLKAEVGENIGLIMTIYDSKGLEFNDVLLYNFFGDSPADVSQWRIILNAVDDKDLPTPDMERNRTRYASICSELKFLYVAITRARENVWIIETSKKGKGMPMERYWTSKKLIRILTPGMDIPRLATTSAPEEWAKKGEVLFHQKKFAEAKLCFGKARMYNHATIANAYLLRTKAECTEANSKLGKQNRLELFFFAAEAFMDCSKCASEKRRPDFLRLSGDCYKRANQFLLAADAYFSAGRFNDAILCYREISRFDEAINILQRERENIKPEIAEDIIRLAKLFYFNQVQVLAPATEEHEAKLRQASSLFEDVDETLQYLDDRDLGIARVAVLVAHARFDDAAELHLQEGRVLEAAKLFVRGNSDKDIQNAGQCIVKGLWQNLSFGTTCGQSNIGLVEEYLELALKMNPTTLDHKTREEISMFRAIASNDKSQLPVLAKSFHVSNDLPAALLCLDHYFLLFPDIRSMPVLVLTEHLEMFSRYIQMLSDIVTKPNPQDSTGLSLLFGFQRLSESQVLLRRGTLLNTESSFGSAEQQDRTISSQDFSNLFQLHLKARLSERLRAENEACKHAQAFTLCLNFSIYNKCPRNPCPDMHIHRLSLDPSFYNARVRLHFRQILVLQTSQAFDSGTTLYSQKRYWLIRLYEAMFPVSHVMGTFSNLNLQSIPEAEKACRIVCEWIRNGIYSLLFPFREDAGALSQLMRLTFMALFLDKDAGYHLGRAPFVYMHPVPHYLDRHGSSIAKELVAALEGSADNSLVMGILALNHIVKQKVAIDIGVFCDVLDLVCRGLVIAHHAQGYAFLHNITLPKSWLLEPIDVIAARTKRFVFLSLLVTPMAELLEQIYTGYDADHLLYIRRNLGQNANIPHRVRSVLIGRISRALCLLGYNMNIPGLRQNILRVMNSLCDKRSVLFPEYKQLGWYFYAKEWRDLASAVRYSTQSSMDELIVILHKSKVDFSRSGVRLRQIIYDDIQEIPVLLGTTRSSANPDPLASTPTAVNSVELVESVEVNKQQDEEVEVTAGPPPEDDDDFEDVEERALGNIVFGSTHEEPEIPKVTEEYIRAVKIIQTAYRRRLARLKKPTIQHTVTRDRFWQDCVNQEEKVSPGHYRKMMWGPLPHVWALLEFLYSCSQAEKSKTKKQMGSELVPSPEELTRLDKALTRINSVIKKTKAIQKSLTATSVLHQRRDCTELRRLVIELGTLIWEELPFELPQDMHEEYNVGYKGIVQPRSPPKKRMKPELNTDDL
ncbi:hypothetical protein K435DRAFT_965733 [Dendrothele bispora CBS 962.96]|uniref:UvrD-like helicase ATP-binding domain-containing protein n=1 Tax=Dendrothele bispora (strain CBS 962.96) TaxID=1314807 RepID=A0A4S8M3V2_DENBC|nr:hypothetical protein K435DRAFT_965733 [Dendrothele bispora CBS 962.96]